MTPLLEYCKKFGHQKLSEEFGINVIEHPTLPLLAAKYNQIESPKYAPEVRYSRGTVFTKDYELVAQPFVRFFNFGESPEEMEKFNWGEFTTYEKVDGSLAIVYYFNDSWHMNTSGSWGLGKVNGWEENTWQELFWKTAEKCGLSKENLDKSLTYIFELCTLSNKVVRMYPEGKVFLLSVFKGKDEFNPKAVQEEAVRVNALLPEQYNFSSFKDIEDFLTQKEKDDLSYEGVVIRDSNNLRFKVKSKTYLALHHLSDNGNIGRPDRLVQIALSNEGDEVLTYMPELKERFDAVKLKLSEEFQKLKDTWYANKDAKDQKTFALAIKDYYFSSILFKLRKKPVEEQNDKTLKELWGTSVDLIVDRLY